MKTLREVTEVPQTEKEFTTAVISLAQILGWRVHRNWTELHSPKGWPDLVLCRESDDGTTAELVVLEIKSERGQLTPEQQEWLTLLGKVPGVRAQCVRPSDWDSLCSLLKA